MKTGESEGEVEGACTGSNFLVRRPRVNRHDAILGMQMRCNKAVLDASRNRYDVLEFVRAMLSSNHLLTLC
jgi:hypothetical protein